MEISMKDVNDALKNLTYFGSKVAAMETLEADMKRGLRDLGSKDEHTIFLVEQGMEQVQLAKIYLTHIDKLLSGNINEYFFQQGLDAAIEGHYTAVAQIALREEEKKREAMKELEELLDRFDDEEFDEDEFEEEEDDEYMEYDEDDFEDDTEEEFDEGHPLLTPEDLDELNTLLDGIDLDDFDEVMKELGE